MQAPTGEWKGVVGIVLMMLSTGIWLYMGLKIFGKFKNTKLIEVKDY